MKDRTCLPGWTAHFAALCAFLALLVLSSAWEMRAARREGEVRLERDARLLAKRLSLYLSGIVWDMDASGARIAIFTEMEDPRLAGMLIRDREGFLEGMRRNTLWEPVPWDDLIPEHSVEATSPVLLEERQTGEVTVYLSRRMLEEELAAAARRELARVAVSALIPCLGLAFLLHRLLLRRAGRKKELAAQTRCESKLFTGDARRDFLRAHGASVALLYHAAAKEDPFALCALAEALCSDIEPFVAHPLYGQSANACRQAAAAVQKAAHTDAAKAARCVEQCAASLNKLLRDIAPPAQDKDSRDGEKA